MLCKVQFANEWFPAEITNFEVDTNINIITVCFSKRAAELGLVSLTTALPSERIIILEENYYPHEEVCRDNSRDGENVEKDFVNTRNESNSSECIYSSDHEYEREKNGLDVNGGWESEEEEDYDIMKLLDAWKKIDTSSAPDEKQLSSKTEKKAFERKKIDGGSMDAKFPVPELTIDPVVDDAVYFYDELLKAISEYLQFFYLDHGDDLLSTILEFVGVPNLLNRAISTTIRVGNSNTNSARFFITLKENGYWSSYNRHLPFGQNTRWVLTSCTKFETVKAAKKSKIGFLFGIEDENIMLEREWAIVFFSQNGFIGHGRFEQNIHGAITRISPLGRDEEVDYRVESYQDPAKYE